MGAALASGVLDRRHRYEVNDNEAPVVRKSVHLNKQSFGKPLSQGTLDLEGFVSPQQKAPWWSPKAESVGAPAADLVALRFALAHNLKGRCDDLFLGAIADPKHQVIVRRVAPSGQAFGWSLLLRNFRDTAVLAWPVQVSQVPGEPSKQFAFLDVASAEPHFIPIFDWSSISGYHFSWASWCEQCRRFPSAARELKPAVRMLLEGGERPLPALAAERAWWSFDLPLLRRIAGHLQIDIPRDNSGALLPTLAAMTMSVLQCDEDAALELLAQRIALLESFTERLDELLELDEASKCLTAEDEQVLQAEKQSMQHRQAAFNDFSKAYFAKKAERRSASSASARRPGAASSSGQRQPKLKRQMMPKKLSEMSQSEARKLMPPTGFLSRNRTDGAWCGRVPPRTQISRSWQKYGEAESLRIVVTTCWRQWCELSGVELSACPMQGLRFDEA